jgi:hypothetical protein
VHECDRLTRQFWGRYPAQKGPGSRGRCRALRTIDLDLDHQIACAVLHVDKLQRVPGTRHGHNIHPLLVLVTLLPGSLELLQRLLMDTSQERKMRGAYANAAQCRSEGAEGEGSGGRAIRLTRWVRECVHGRTLSTSTSMATPRRLEVGLGERLRLLETERERERIASALAREEERPWEMEREPQSDDWTDADAIMSAARPKPSASARSARFIVA